MAKKISTKIITVEEMLGAINRACLVHPIHSVRPASTTVESKVIKVMGSTDDKRVSNKSLKDEKKSTLVDSGPIKQTSRESAEQTLTDDKPVYLFRNFSHPLTLEEIRGLGRMLSYADAERKPRNLFPCETVQ